MRKMILAVIFIYPLILVAEEEKKVPNFSLRDIDGNEVILDSILAENKVVMISFWSIHCKPCVRKLSKMTAMYDKYHEYGFEVLAINIDAPRRRSHVKPFVKSRKWNFRVLLDSDGSVKDLLNVIVLPTTFILDRDGKILFHRIGHNRGDEKLIEEIVAGICGDKEILLDAD